MQKGFSLITILLGVLVVVGIGGGAYLLGQNNFKPQIPPNQKACTLEAKLCPDGSSVGRTGPNCEFAKCPDEILQEKTANWNTYKNAILGLSFKYPPNYEIEEREGSVNLDLFELRIFSKPVTSPSLGRVVLVNILIHKSSSDDKSEDIGSYKFTSNIFNSFTNYVGESDLLVGTIIDTTNGFATKIGEQKIDGLRTVKYKLQRKIDKKDFEGIAIRNENKSFNIYTIDNSMDPNYAAPDQQYQGDTIQTIISTIKFLSF